MTQGDRATSAGPAALRGGVLLLVVWLASGLRVDFHQPVPASASPSPTEAAISRGDYAGAARSAREFVATLELNQSSSPTQLARARDLLVAALVGDGKAGDQQTLDLARANLETRKRLDSSDSIGVAISLHNLADVHFQRGEYARALALHEDGLNARMRALAPGGPDIADSLERLATTQMRMERYDAARQNLDRAHAIRVTRASQEPLGLAHTQELIAWLHRYAGDYPAAKAPLTAALGARRRLAPDHPGLVTTIEVQGDLFMLEGDVTSAARSWQEALTLAERTLGREHPLISTLERRLALSANAVGNRAEGRQRLDNALRIAERTRAPCDPELIVLINDSAGSLVFDGEYVEARTRFARTLELSQRCFGPNNSNTATVVFNLAALTAQMGDFAEAERLYERAIEAWSARGSEDPYVAKGLDALGEVFETSGDLTRARSLFERALAIRRSIRPDHPDVAWTLTNLARVVAASGDVPLALHHLTEATDIYKRNGTSIEPDHLARTVSQRGDIQARRGDFTMAREDFAEALALRERLFGSEHPLTGESRLKVASADFALGRYDDALAAARKARESGLDHVKFTVRYLPERRALAYASRTTQGLALELSLATATPSAAPSQFFDAVVRSRSIVLDELGARTRVLSDPRPPVAAMQARLNVARQRFANLMLRSMSAEGSSPDAAELLNAARHEREEAEQALAEQSAAFRSQLLNADVGLAQIRSSLPPGSALVCFVRYDRTVMSDDAPRPGVSQQRSARIASIVPSYMAFVLRAGDPEPSLVPLGVATNIDGLVTSWRRLMLDEIAGATGRGTGASLETLGTQLRRSIWDPLTTHINGVSRVFVVPDGPLNLLPIGALPAERGGYVIERGPVIHYLSAERDMVRPEERLTGSAGLLAIGGPAFSDISSFAALTRSTSQQPVAPPSASGAMPDGQQSQSFRGSTPGCQNFSSIDFKALPGSRVEAEVIAQLWDQIGLEKPSGQNRAQVLTGPLATERAFKEFGPKRRILHLATHGFFLGDECNPTIEGTRAVGGLTTTGKSSTAFPLSRPSEAVENPLLLSGLALAGANRRASAGLDEEDGVLTSEEVAALNLEGVEWAVLSACDTGLGTLSAGEGIFGLRRAFHVAGVRTVIMSLWPVEDRAARQWMEALYRARLVDHLDTADSVRQASLTLIRERRANGQSTHPFYWASFVAAGDWR